MSAKKYMVTGGFGIFTSCVGLITTSHLGLHIDWAMIGIASGMLFGKGYGLWEAEQ